MAPIVGLPGYIKMRCRLSLIMFRGPHQTSFCRTSSQCQGGALTPMVSRTLDPVGKHALPGCLSPTFATSPALTVAFTQISEAYGSF